LSTLLSINNYHYRRGGADVLYLEHANLFARAGWKTHFFSMRHADNLPCPDAADFAEHIDFAAGHRSVGHALSVIYSRGARARLAALLDRTAVDIAHVHNIYHHLSPSVLFELKARHIPVVMTAHDLKLVCPNYRMLSDGVCERCKGGRLWQPVLRRCHQDSLAASAMVATESMLHQTFGFFRRHVDRVVTPSRFYRDLLIEWGWPADRLVHVPNFAPRRAVTPKTPPGATILYVGRLAPEKGIATLIRAATLADVAVDICGSGPQAGSLRGLAETLKAPVHFLGRRDDVGRLLAAARAVVLPSEWYENGPLAAIEAFEAGRPLIGARIGGLTELIDEGKTGWGFASGDADDLARALRLASQASDDALEGMAAACRHRFAAEHSEEVYRARIAAIYNDLLQ
jgi:glycosyltransferase involved in cell wall biosynthesis